MKPFCDEDLGGWLAPFVIGTVNAPVVRRSNALGDFASGRKFRYRELMLTGGGPVGMAKAAGVSGGIAGLCGASHAGCSPGSGSPAARSGEGPVRKPGSAASSTSTSTRRRAAASFCGAKSAPRATPATRRPRSCSVRAPSAWRSTISPKRRASSRLHQPWGVCSPTASSRRGRLSMCSRLI